MKIGVVILGINLWDRYTKPCIDSCKSKHELRFVFVDNGSRDNTLNEAHKMCSANFIHRRYEENVGCQKAWNWAINDSFEKDCRYVLVLNNDVLLHPEAIDRLASRFEIASKDTGIVSCLDVRVELPVPSMILGMEIGKDKIECPESEHPNFSAFMISKECWNEVGEFDEGFFPAYFEDNDYHYRMKLAGLKAITLPTALFYHFGSRTQNEAQKTPIVPGPAFEKNRNFYAAKWGGVPGSETYKIPFNDFTKTVKSTLQGNSLT